MFAKLFKKKHAQEQAKATFVAADTNKDGTLSVGELQALLQKAGVQWNTKRVQGLPAALDENGDGVVQRDEYVRALEDLRKVLDAAAAAAEGGDKAKMVSDITGIPSMGQYTADMAQQVPTGRVICVYSIDMANLKVLNESTSHDAADAVLTWYAEELTRVVKPAEESILVDKVFAYHMHGDEFCAVIVAAEGAAVGEFTAYARDTLLPLVAAIRYDYEAEKYPESYMRVGALSSVDATYKTADDLQELVGKNLKLTYPDRSKVCPLNGRVNYSFASTDEEGRRRAKEQLEKAAAEAGSKTQVELELVQLEAELAGVEAGQLQVLKPVLAKGEDMEKKAMPALLQKVGATQQEAHALVEVDWSGKHLTADDASVIVWMLRNGKLATATSLNVDGHALQIEELKGTKPTEKIDLSHKRLGVASAIIIASCIKENGMLKELNVGSNGITGDAAENLATVVLEQASMTDFCGIPLVSLRENTITELDLKGKGVDVPGAIVLSKLLPSAAALTSLNLGGNQLCGLDFRGRGTYTAEGITKLCEGLKGSAVTSLRFADDPSVRFYVNAR
jgi:GGDEF domain-containing protein